MRIILCIFGLLLAAATHGQVSGIPPSAPATGDTSTVPYWVRMMEDNSVNFFRVQRAFNIYWQDRPITKGSGWKVFKRWEYLMQYRVDSLGNRPAPDAVQTEMVKYLGSGKSTAGTWTNLGPSTIPGGGTAGYEGLGRINHVAFHPTDPNRLYISAASGGMWQSNDGGTTWSTTTGSLPSLGTSFVLVDKFNPNIIYLGTGDQDHFDSPGIGVYKSTDGGVTWAPSNTGMGNRTVGRILQHPSRDTVLIAATTSGIYRSRDGGANWTLRISGFFQDMCFKPDDPEIIYASASSNFFRSSDNGKTFVQISSGITSGERGAIAVTAANPTYVYFLQSNTSSGFKGLYRSTDAGLNFTAQSTTPNILDYTCTGSGTGGQGWYDLAIAADPANAETIYTGGVDIWKSTNGGVSWTKKTSWSGGCSVAEVHADQHFLGFAPLTGLLWATNDGGNYSTSNGGTNWTDHTTGMCIGQIYKLGQSALVKNQVINGFQDNGTYLYTASSWQISGGGDGMECLIDYNNSSYSYYSIYYGDIYRKFNNGSDNHIAGNGTNGISESGAWVTPYALHETDFNTMFIGYKNVWRSANVRSSPPTWTKISDNLGGSNTVNLAVVEPSPANTNILYVARSDKKLFRTSNCMAAAPVWTDLTASLPQSYTPSDIEAHPTDSNIVYMTLNQKVYRSTDRGASWTNITGNLPNITFNSILYYQNAPEGLYVGTDAGVYYKDQTMTSWISFSSGLPAGIRVLELEAFYDPVNSLNDVIRAATFGRGLWSSDPYFPSPLTRTWRGSVSANWATAKNWFPLGAPSSVENVVIGSGSLQSPVISVSGAQCLDLTIQPDRTLTIQTGITLTVFGTCTLSGPAKKSLTPSSFSGQVLGTSGK
jgi:photosystem II stability/assembly factor-like uncharacterized protein